MKYFVVRVEISKNNNRSFTYPLENILLTKLSDKSNFQVVKENITCKIEEPAFLERYFILVFNYKY